MSSVVALWRIRFATMVLIFLAAACGLTCAKELHQLLPPNEYIPVERISTGMRGYCKSTFNGTKVSTLPVTVIGVLKGVDFGMDLILIRIDGGPVVSNGWGVAAGMSGSPVYIAGKLAGAISYAWAFSKAPIAGVTPIKSMVESTFAASATGAASMPKTVRLKPVSGSILLSGRRIKSVRLRTCLPDEGEIRVSQDEILLVPVATPLMVHGMPKASLERLKKLLQPYALIPMLSPGKPVNAPKLKVSLEPGAAVGAQLTCGDIELTAIGALTYRKGNVILAFGHPFLLAGETSIPLTTAYVHGVLPSQYISIKLASPLSVVGAFTQDRAFAMSGIVGLRPKMLQLGISVSDNDRGVKRLFNVSVFRHRELTVLLVDLLISLAFTNVTSGIPSGTTFVSYEISADGLPKIKRQNAFVESRASLIEKLLGYSMPSTAELIQTLLLLEENRFERVNVKSVLVKLENTSKRQEAFIERVVCDKRVARPKDEVKLTIHMRRAHGGWEQKEIKLCLPDVRRVCTLRIGVSGGADAQRLRNRLGILQRRPNSLSQLIEGLVNRERNDQLFVCLQLPSMDAWVNGRLAHNMPFKILEEMNALGDDMFHVGYGELSKCIDVGYVVRGMKMLSIRIEPEYTKDVPQPSQELERARMRQEEGALELFEQLGQLLGIQGEAICGSNNMTLKVLAKLWSGMFALSLQGGEEEEPAGELTGEASDEQGDEEKIQDESAQRATEGDRMQHLPEGALKARKIELKSQKELMRGKCDGAFVASDGSVRIGLKASSLVELGDGGIWRAAIFDNGTLYACSWQSGIVYSISNGSAKAICSFHGKDGLHCIPTALLLLGDRLLIGTSPNGEVYSMNVSDNDGSVTPGVWLKIDCKHIWAMRQSRSGDVLIGTGLPGRVFQVTKDGRTKLLLEALDEHVMALSVGNDGSIYAGTYPMGKLWRILPDGSYRLIWETKRGAISSLYASPDGDVYIGTTPHGEIFRLSGSGECKLLCDTPSRHIADIYPSGDGTLIVSGITPHAIYLVDMDSAHGQALKFSNEFAAQFVSSADGLLSVMSISGKVVKLYRSGIGEYISPAFVLPSIANWRILKCLMDAGDDAVVVVESRSGNSELPDETWSDWERAELSEDGFLIKSPPARALQWRIKVESNNNAHPKLYGAVVSFTPINVAPSVQFVSPAAGAIIAKTVTVEWKAYDANGDELEFEIYCSSDGGKTWQRVKEAKPERKGKKAESESSKDTSAQEGVKQEGDGQRPELQKGETGIVVETPPMPEVSEELVEQVTSESAATEQTWRKQKLEWDTTQLPDGRYVLKVVASDVLSNPLNQMKAEAVSPSFIIDNTPPIVVSPKMTEVKDAKGVGDETFGAPPQRIFVRDETTWVLRAEFKVGDKWYPLMCADGSFDSREEELIIPVDRLPSGKHTLDVRIFDAAGNSATFQYRYFKGEKQ
ncbi:MAG: hypothetical protein RMK18_00125 [Armatimonadota bacterium]|nr:hypothetical protein [Armatimonadota bacterium]MDW8024262.1 hypothetical protein [Armatimonadota bacterium]